MKLWRTILPTIIATALAALPAPSLADPYEDAVTAYDADDYEKAEGLFRPLADSGDAAAQYYMGVLHEYGNGIEQSDEARFTGIADHRNWVIRMPNIAWRDFMKMGERLKKIQSWRSSII